jgi:large subunit ribosomal protein L28
MAKRCDLTGTGPQVGNNVSHSQRKTRRRFLPNLQNVTLRSDAMGQNLKFKITAATLRTVNFKGGLDSFLINTRAAKLTESARKLRKKIQKKIDLKSEATPSTAAPEAAPEVEKEAS